MSPQQLLNLIKKIPSFNGLSDDVLNDLLKEKVFLKNSVLMNDI